MMLAVLRPITRDTFAEDVADMLRVRWPQAAVTLRATTSDCPLIRVAFPEGDAYNVTITRARS